MDVTFERGASQTANYIRDQLASCARELQKSAAFGVENVIRGELAEVWEECSEPDWDGYHAFPVTSDAYTLAEKFLRALPLGTPLPSIGAEPDGDITMDWGRSPRRRLSVSVSPNGDLHYAALVGPGRRCGSEPFFGEVSEAILNLIRQVC